ncbi:phasin family protein [Sphingomonas sp. LB3N6]|uniref:phasin family protein n=1 Tax=Sphingomonas fucosidasi TaxID=3096164 RepID=UPI002FC77244
MVDIVKRTAKAGSKLAAAAKPVAAVKAATAKASARTVAKPAKPAPEPIAKTSAPQPLAAAFVSPHPDIPAPIPATAPTGIPASETKDATMDTIQSITEKTKALFSNGFTGANTAEYTEQAKGAMERSAKMAEDFVAFGKGNIEALVESSKIAAKNVEALGQEAAEYAKTSFESATEAAKTLAAAKSPTEFMKLQGDYARTAFDTMIAEGSRSTERMLKMFGEFAQPISNRVAVATDKMKISA